MYLHGLYLGKYDCNRPSKCIWAIPDFEFRADIMYKGVGVTLICPGDVLCRHALYGYDDDLVVGFTAGLLAADYLSKCSKRIPLDQSILHHIDEVLSHAACVESVALRIISNIIFLCVVLLHSVVVYDFFQVNNTLMLHIEGTCRDDQRSGLEPLSLVLWPLALLA